MNPALGQRVTQWLMSPLLRVYEGVSGNSDEVFAELLKNLKIGYDCPPADLEHVPASGPILVVANHPFGLAEGIVLGALLSAVRSDVRLLANSMLTSVPGVDRRIIPVNPFGGPDAIRENHKPLRQAIEWLKSGGLLVVFPAGEVASFQFPALRISDPKWTANVARLSKLAAAPVLPVFFHGTNSPVFHMTGLIHPRLRTALLPHELLNKAGSEIRVSIGAVIPADRLAAAADPTAYLRGRTLMLEARAEKLANHGGFPWIKQATIAEAQEPASIAAELANLPPDQTLLTHGEFRVCVAQTHQIPHTLLEIGRLREITFRQAGEGAGKSRDLDSFDRYYSHLFVWNEETRALIGAYRLAKTDQAIAARGVAGLYTNTLFHLTPGFYRSIHPALELGRSFVRIEEQKSFLPLLLLWKGIGHYVAQNPGYRMLFGPVSISKDYTSSSRALMVSYLKAKCGDDGLAAHIKPRRPFRPRWQDPCDPRNFSSLLTNLDELSEVVADIEPDHKKLPILIRHYLNLGGRILDFNVDRSFSNVVDGLVVLDLALVGKRHLERYMGPRNAAEFLKLHGSSAGTAA